MSGSDQLLVSIDGRLTTASEARISPLDHAVTVGDGVFETLLVTRRVPFAWGRHYARLVHSAAGLGINVIPKARLRDAALELIAANGLREGRLRVTVTAGEGPPGSGAAAGPPVTFMVASPLEPPSERASVVVAPWTRNENDACTGLKTISYAGNVRALAFAAERGADEAIFENTAGNLCEATGSNVFVVMGGELVTPPLSAGCLAGVTRALVLELATTAGIAAHERDLRIDDLRDADEAFLSSTTRMVQPIDMVDGIPLGTVGGPVSSQLARALRDLVARDLDP